MKTALLQCNPVTGDIAGNVEKIAAAVRRAGDFLHANRNNQAGDPKKAAVFLCDMVEKGYLPSRILIGAKCCADVRDMLKEQLENIASYEAASAQTDF